MFSNLFRRKKSKNVAKDRLKIVLIHDRNLISNVVLTKIKNEIIKVISKYVKFDHENIDVQFDTKTERRNKGELIVNVPVEKIIAK